MGISFHITSVREGTIFNVMQFLSLERVTGNLTIRFGRNIPEVTVYFVAGSVGAAEFGDLKGSDVLDLLLCQEFAIKEVAFAPGRVKDLDEDALVVQAANISGTLLNVSKSVDECESRSLVYGLIPTKDKRAKSTDSLLHLIYEFSKWEDSLERTPPSPNEKQAPLNECMLITRALRKGTLSYQTPMVPLKSLKQLIAILQPLSEKETNNLRGYMRSLLPHPKATHISIERFYAFASAIESIAQRRSDEVGDRARKTIHTLIQHTTKTGDELPSEAKS